MHAEEVPSEQRDRATRMALDRLQEYPSPWAAAQALGPKLGVGPETLRKWSSEELAEIKRLRAENRDLKEANEILKAASIFFARDRLSSPARSDRRARCPAGPIGSPAGRRPARQQPSTGQLATSTPIRFALQPWSRRRQLPC
jgi:transposase-like protein